MNEEEKIQKPEWFNVDNYNDAYSFTKEQWFEQVAIRFMLYCGTIDDIYCSTSVNHFNEMMKQKEPFLKSPETTLAFLELLQIPNHDKTNTNKELFYKSLWSTTTSEAVNNFAAITNDETELSRLIETGKSHQINKFSKTPVNKGSIKPIDGLYFHDDILGRRHLTIDINAKNEDIFNDFKKWLKYSKQQFEKKEIQLITEKKIEELTDNRVLAYIDLLIWSKLKNEHHKKITKIQIIEWLELKSKKDKNKVLGEKYLRDMLDPLVNKLMTFNSVIKFFKRAYGDINKQQIKDILIMFMKKHNLQS